MAVSSPQQPNTLGKASLALGIASISLVFGIGLCALIGAQQGWLAVVATLLFICGASSAFLGFLGLMTGMAGLFGQNRPKANAVVGMTLGTLSACLFLVILRSLGGA
jgi:hypothetical protein